MLCLQQLQRCDCNINFLKECYTLILPSETLILEHWNSFECDNDPSILFPSDSLFKFSKKWRQIVEYWLDKSPCSSNIAATIVKQIVGDLVHFPHRECIEPIIKNLVIFLIEFFCNGAEKIVG